MGADSHGLDRLAVGGAMLELVQGDIALQDVDAIVNAANAALAGGGGVDGAIHAAAGPAIKAETRLKYPEGCSTGSAIMTGGGRLRARNVIHAVGPIWRGGVHGEPARLASAYEASLRLADENQLISIAFPSISTGAYSFPLELAAPIALQTVVSHLSEKPTSLRLVRFFLYGARTFDAYKQALASVAENLSQQH